MQIGKEEEKQQQQQQHAFHANFNSWKFNHVNV